MPVHKGIDLNFSSERLASMSDAVRKVINEYPVGYQFHGNELHKDVTLLYPPARYMYTDTIQRAFRRHCRSIVKCINHNKSLYERVEG